MKKVRVSKKLQHTLETWNLQQNGIISPCEKKVKEGNGVHQVVMIRGLIKDKFFLVE